MHTNPHFGEGEVVGARGSAMVLFEIAVLVSFTCDHCAISMNHSTAICHRMSQTLKSKFGEEGNGDR